MNDRNEKQHPSEEESEYHFSDDEVSYEVEPETSKPASKPASKFAFISQLSSSKRMIIIVVFLALLFVVYKMISPTNVAPPTDITPVSPPQAQAPATPQVTSVSQPPLTAPTSVVPPATAIPPTATVTPPAPPASSVPAQAIPAVPATPPPAPPQQMTVQPVVGMPNVIPVQAPVSTTYTNQPPVAVSQLGTMAENNQQAMAQLKEDYTQKINDFSAQNKITQDQLQLLSTKVAAMENEIHQLVETMTRRGPSSAPAPTTINVVPRVTEVKSTYTVQAIIPGRAWLKTIDGETVTVAEGDLIRGLGRVTKIDPYDGVVEVTNGNQVVTISYGAGS